MRLPVSSSPATIPTGSSKRRWNLARITAAFDATDFDRLERFFDSLAAAVDHVMVTGPGP
jgi:hypothetical protein